MPKEDTHSGRAEPAKRQGGRGRGGAGRHTSSGRFPSYTDEIGDRILAYVKGGNYLDQAGEAAGISRVTLGLWMERGARARRAAERGDRLGGIDKKLAAFSAAMDQAVAQGEVVPVLRIAKAGQDGDWKADSWRLQHGPAQARWKHGGPDTETEGGAFARGFLDAVRDEYAQAAGVKRKPARPPTDAELLDDPALREGE